MSGQCDLHTKVKAIIARGVETISLEMDNCKSKNAASLLNLSSCCLVMVEWLFLAVPWGCLQFMIVVFPDHTHFLFFCIRGISFIKLRVNLTYHIVKINIINV